MLTHEPQNREMALIRCPNCDTLHDLESSFFASGARKVRCASCRTIWEAVDPESNILPRTPAPAANVAPEPETEPAWAPEAAAEPEDDMVAMAMPIPASKPATSATAEPAPMPVLAEDEAVDISAEDLEALFAEPAPKPAAKPAAAVEEEPFEFDPASLAREQDAAMAAAAAAAAAEKEKAGTEGDPNERRSYRRSRHMAANDSHRARREKKQGRSSMAVMVMAGGIGTLAVLGFMRHEIVRFVPAAAPVFEAIGLGAGASTLDISDVRSKLAQEDGRETLEVTGTIINTARAPQKVPVMRLSIRSASGQEIYVWTAAADVAELAPGEKTQFRRRLASPPAEAHSIMVRFVAKDDIVASIR